MCVYFFSWLFWLIGSLARAIVISWFGCEKLGKRKVINEEELETMMLPVANDVLGMAVRMLGLDRILVRCQDGKERLCRVRGKLKSVDQRGRHCFGFSLGVSIRQTRRHFLAVQEESNWMVEKTWSPYNVREKGKAKWWIGTGWMQTKVLAD